MKHPKKQMVVSTQSNCIKSKVQLSALPTHQTMHHKQKNTNPSLKKHTLITHHYYIQAAIPHLGLAGVFHLHFFSNPITTSNDVFDCLSWFGKFAKIFRPWLHRRTHLWLSVRRLKGERRAVDSHLFGGRENKARGFTRGYFGFDGKLKDFSLLVLKILSKLFKIKEGPIL